MPRLLITHPEHGVYLGSAMGLGFWSKMDPVGQTSAVTFADHTEVKAYVDSWDDFMPDITTHPVVADEGTYASIAACVNAGLDGWQL